MDSLSKVIGDSIQGIQVNLLCPIQCEDQIVSLLNSWHLDFIIVNRIMGICNRREDYIPCIRMKAWWLCLKNNSKVHLDFWITGDHSGGDILIHLLNNLPTLLITNLLTHLGALEIT